MSIGEDSRVVALINMIEYLLADIIEEKGVIDRWMAHGIISAVEATMEAELFDLSGIRIT